MHGTLPPGDEGIAALVSRLSDEAKAFAQAEVQLYRAMAMAKMRALKGAAICGTAALLIVGSAITALIVGVIMTLRPSLGPGWATLVTIVGALIVAGLLGWMAAASVRKAFGGGK